MALSTHTPQELPIPFEAARVADAMSPGVISCPPETPLRVVARMMATFSVHSVFVFEHPAEDDHDRTFWGVVSDLDLVAAAWREIDGRTAGGSAVTPFVTVPTDAPLSEAAELMSQRGVAHLAVVEPLTGHPVGVISTLDLARALAAGSGASETQPSG